MKTAIVSTPITDLLVIEVEFFKDARGFFIEPWNKKVFKEIGLNIDFVQEGHSGSKKNVLRGLHYQNKTAPMGKLVRCTVGKVLDVAVDIRPTSTTYGKWFSIELNPEDMKQLYVPPGFAHGFLTLSDYAEVQYKQTGFYTPGAEGIIIWNDPEIAINWLITNPTLSDKDKNGQSFKDYRVNPAF